MIFVIFGNWRKVWINWKFIIFEIINFDYKRKTNCCLSFRF